MSSLPPARIAVIGAGLIGRRHISHVVSEPECTLAAIVESHPSGAAIAESHKAPLFASLADLVVARDAGQIQLDAVIICTPTHTHVQLGIEAVRAGLDCLIEKPIASTAEESRPLLESIEKSDGVKVLIGQHRRFNPYTIALSSAIRSGRLGQVLAIQGIWATRKGGAFGGFDYYEGWKVDPKSGGTISINLIHDIDLLRFLIGDITSVCAVLGPNTRGHPVEETGAVVLQFANGAVGTFVFSDAAASPFCWEGATGENPDLVGHYSKDVYTVLGTKGSIQLPTLELHSFAHLPEPDRHWLSRLSVDKCYHDQAQSLLAEPPFTLQLRHFVRVIRREEEPSCSAQEAYRSVQALEAVAESCKSGQTIRL